MAKYHGKTGTVTLTGFGGGVAEVISFAVECAEGVTEDYAMGDGAITYEPTGNLGWSGTIDCFYDPDDITNLDAGEEVAAYLYPMGESEGVALYGGVVVASISRSVTRDGFNKMSIAFKSEDLTVAPLPL